MTYSEKVCENCEFADEMGKELFCNLKDLYTIVEPRHFCDETDFHGNLQFAVRKGLWLR